VQNAQSAKVICRTLRKNSTEAEKRFWVEVRNRRFYGRKFLRQHPLFFRHQEKTVFCIVDFYCHEHRLVVEIDGKNHNYQKEYDTLRTHMINTMGIKVIRFGNDEIKNDMSNVLKKLEFILEI
jgi:very-short-patch-repair endonuclease